MLGGVAAPGLGVLVGAGPPATLGSPAHDLVGQQHAAHLRVLVLALVDNGLCRGQAEARVTLRPRLWRQIAPGTAGLGGRQVRDRREGVAAHPTTLRKGHTRSGEGPPHLATSFLGHPPGLHQASAGKGCGKGRGGRGRAQESRARGHPTGTQAPWLSAPPPGRVLLRRSTPSSNLHIGRSRSERAATKEVGRASGGRRPTSFAPRSAPALGSARWSRRLLPTF